MSFYIELKLSHFNTWWLPDYDFYKCTNNHHPREKPSLVLPFPSLPFPSLPFFPPSRFLHRTVLYYTVLYCTILYYTVLYCTILSPVSSLQSPSLQKFICFETLTRLTRLNADILLSLLAALSRLFRILCAASSRNVVFTKKRKNGRDSWTLHTLRAHTPCTLRAHTPCNCARKVVHFPFIHYYLIQVKNRAWSPSLPFFFPSLIRHVFYIVLKKEKEKKRSYKR